MALFTVETAAEMGRRSAALRKQREAMPQPTVEPTAILPLPTVEPTESSSQREARRVREQLDALNEQIDHCEDPDTWDALTRSKERLFKIWARLAQLPTDPKPAVSRTRSSQPMPEPKPLPNPESGSVPGTGTVPG